MSTSPSPRGPSSFYAGASEWERYRDELRRLYIDEHKSMVVIRATMKEKHNFNKSMFQYRIQFKKWRFFESVKFFQLHFYGDARVSGSTPLGEDHRQPEASSKRNLSSSHFEVQPSTPSIEPLLPTDPIDNMNLVDKWKKSAVFSERLEDVGIIGRLYRSCIIRYKSLLKISIQTRHLTEADNDILQSQYQLLRLWGDDFGVLEGEVDKKLERSRDLKIMVLSIFVSIGNVIVRRLVRYVTPSVEYQRDITEIPEINMLLDEAKCHLSERIASDNDEEEDDGESSSDDSECDFPTDSIGEVLADIKAYTSSLIDLIPSIEWPVKDPEEKETAVACSAVVDRAPHQYYSDMIRERFPKAAASLLEHLGQTSWERYKRVQAERERNTAMGNAVFNMELGTVCDESPFNCSGTGSLISAAETICAQSVISAFSVRADSSSSSRAGILPLPQEAKKGLPFTCNACEKRVSIETNRDWRKHLYQDLQPYICFYENCSFGNLPFADRELWTDHIVLEHGFISDQDHFKCPLCCEELASGRIGISGHLGQHMEEISLNALPSGAEEPSSETVSLGSGASSVNGFVHTHEEEKEEEKEGLTRCICGHTEIPYEIEATILIQCDSCYAWQHGMCVGILNESHSPEIYFCEQCKPELHQIFNGSRPRRSQYSGLRGIEDSRAPSTSLPDVCPVSSLNFSQMSYRYGTAIGVPGGGAMPPQPSQGWLPTASEVQDAATRPTRSPIHPNDSTLSLRREGTQRTNVRVVEIPPERALSTLDNLIAQTTDAEEMKVLLARKRILRIRQAALDSRQRDKLHSEQFRKEKKQSAKITTQHSGPSDAQLGEASHHAVKNDGVPKAWGLPPETLKEVISYKTKLGCVACYQRKLRCDKNHPACNQCMRRGIFCAYTPRGHRGHYIQEDGQAIWVSDP